MTVQSVNIEYFPVPSLPKSKNYIAGCVEQVVRYSRLATRCVPEAAAHQQHHRSQRPLVRLRCHRVSSSDCRGEERSESKRELAGAVGFGVPVNVRQFPVGTWHGCRLFPDIVVRTGGRCLRRGPLTLWDVVQAIQQRCWWWGRSSPKCWLSPGTATGPASGNLAS